MELIALVTLSIFYLLSFLPSSIGKWQYYGVKWIAGNRAVQTHQPPFNTLNNWGARAQRAYENLQTNYPPFAVALILLLILHKTTPYTGYLSLTYVAMRITHFASYIAGNVALRAISFALSWAINIYLLTLLIV